MNDLLHIQPLVTGDWNNEVERTVKPRIPNPTKFSGDFLYRQGSKSPENL